MPKGAFRTLLWYYLAHGAEAVLFWRWRAGLGGQEQYHGTVLGFDDEPGLSRDPTRVRRDEAG